MERFVIVAHKFLPQPDDDLVSYLSERLRYTVLHIYHSFPDAEDRCSFYRLYEGGELKASGQTRDYRHWPDALIYAKEMAFTLLWTFRAGGRWDRYVGMDGLCALFGNILRAAGRVKKTVFWAIDFVPRNRFRSRLKNAIYAAVNRRSCLDSDEMWDLGVRMAEARARFAGIPLHAYRKHKVVPYGLWLERIHPVPFIQCERTTLTFMGHLLEKQGVHLVLRALPLVISRIPAFVFNIIGDGAYRQSLQALARELRVDEHCRFLGKIDDSTEVERIIARSAVSIAPYVRSLDTWTAYADPGKVKTYLACGVPVLLTDVPWIAGEIERRGCGNIITEDPAQIADAVVSVFEPITNQRMRDSARRFAREFDFANLFETALGESMHALSRAPKQ